MKKLTILFLLILYFLASGFQLKAQETFEMKSGDTTYVMQKYFICFLSRGDKSGFDPAQVAEIQGKHLDHLSLLADDGKISIAGPFDDDQDLRGIVIFNVATIEEAMKLESEDPAVNAGILTMEIRPWWSAKGSSLR